jgi:hypothetical protein
MPNSNHRLSITLIAVVLCTGIVVAEQLVVAVDELVVRSGKGSMYPPVATLSQKDKFEALEHQPNGWLRVKAGDQEGFVKETALTPRKVSNLSGAAGSAQASDVNASAAARGLDPNTIKYATTKGMKTDGYFKMLENRNAVVGEPWLKFTDAGKVGPSKTK